MRLRLQFWPTVFAVPALALLIGLGIWQLNRLEFKTDLIARIEARTTSAPIALPQPAAWGELDLDALAYRPVRAQGTWRHDQEIHVFTHLAAPRGGYGGAGYWVMTPLRLDDGAVVMVNRGFVPQNAKAQSVRAEGLTQGEVTVTGLLRQPQPRGTFVPEDQSAENVWFTRNPAAMARHLGMDRVAPFFIDAFASNVPGGLPQGGETRLDFPNNHLQYAITWFGLALGLIGVFAAYHISQAREARGQDD